MEVKLPKTRPKAAKISEEYCGIPVLILAI